VATILVVDDESQARTQLGAILGVELGHNVHFALDGYGAIALYERCRPDLVITDLVMPHLSGLELIEYLTAKFPRSRIIAISGKAPDRLVTAWRLGASAVLTKPLDRDELVGEVERLIGPAPIKEVGERLSSPPDRSVARLFSAATPGPGYFWG
jgi:adenylate cyclase